MEASRNYHTKWIMSERERQIPYDITYMWTLKYDTNEPIYESEIESGTQNRLVIAGVGGRREMDWEFGISKGKLVCTEWIN